MMTTMRTPITTLIVVMLSGPRTWLVSSAMSVRNGSMYLQLTSARAWACLFKTHRRLHPLMSATDVLDFAACGVCAGWKPRRKSTKRTPTVQLSNFIVHRSIRGTSACGVCAAGSQGGSQPSEYRRCNFIVYRSTEGHLPVVSALLEVKAEVNQANPDGATSSYIAARIGHLPVVSALLEARHVKL